MTDFLPLFPLRLVVFPGENLNLHIFEPRYRQLIRECQEQPSTFGIPTFVEDRVQALGTEMTLVGIEKYYPNGEMDVKTRAVGRFKIIDFYNTAPDKLYAGGDVERIAEDADYAGSLAARTLILEQLGELFKIMGLKDKLHPDPVTFRTFMAGHQMGLSLEQEYQFLCILGEEERQDFILQHLEKVIPTVREMERLRERVQMNGYFKNMPPLL